MESRMRSWLLLVVCVSLSLMVGCPAADGPETVPVSGTVTYQGAPLAGASVVFSPKAGAARNASGTTDAQGKYQLSMFGENDGTVIGPHAVSISKSESGGESVDAANPDEAYTAMMEEAAKPSSAKPKEGEFPTASDLEANVTADGPNVFDFDL